MTIKFELTEDDFVAYNYFYVRKGLPKMRLYLLLLFCLVVFLCFEKFQEGADTIYDYATLPTLFLSMYFFLVLYRWSKWAIKSKVQKLIKSGRNAGLLGSRTLMFKEDGLYFATEFEEAKLKWNSFEDMKESPEHLFLYKTVNQAIIIPKHIFLLEQELHDIRAFIERKLEQHQ